MNLSAIGASGGGGSVGTTGGGGARGRIATGGGGGAAFCLNRNRFRSADSGFGRSLCNASRCTTGGPAAVLTPRLCLAGCDVSARLDVGAGAVDVPGHICTITTARMMASAASTSCRRRSDATGPEPKIRGEVHGEHQQRLGRIALGQRDIVDDHK